jgi:hypothetical protein
VVYYNAPDPDRYAVRETADFIKAHIFPKCNGTRILSKKVLEEMILESEFVFLTERSRQSRRSLTTKAMDLLAPRWGQAAWIIK